jgi:ABC-type nitrate/sulfonate/bicarbonate transport system permease component
MRITVSTVSHANPFRVLAKYQRRVLAISSVLVTLLVWAAASAASSPILIPSPWLTADTAVGLIRDGSLLNHVYDTLARVLVGFALGCLVAVPLGLTMGQFRPARWLLEPYVESLRFIPSIAILGLVVVLFGLSESGKFFLIFYATVFVVLLNTMIGVLRVPLIIVRSGRSLGATARQIFFWIIIPATIPYVITGMRMAMGNAFMSVVAAELLFATSGVGFLISNARVFYRTDELFVGIGVLGLMGFASDQLLRALGGRFGEKFGVRF